MPIDKVWIYRLLFVFHNKPQFFKKSRDHNHVPFVGDICCLVARIDIAYLCIKCDDFRFSRSSDVIGAPEIFNGSHRLTTPL